MGSRFWPDPDDFKPAQSRLLRRQWEIHPYRVCERAGIKPYEYKAWEEGRMKDPPKGLGLMIYAAIRQLVAETAILTVQALADVEPYARQRIEYNALVRSIVGPRRRHPTDPRLPPPPRAATPAKLGWIDAA